MNKSHIRSAVIVVLGFLANGPVTAHGLAADRQPASSSAERTLTGTPSVAVPADKDVRARGPIVNCWYAVSPDGSLRGYVFQGPTARSYIPPYHAKMQPTIEELAAALFAHYRSFVLRPYYDGNREEKTVRPLSEDEIRRLSELLPFAQVEKRDQVDR